MRVWVDITDSSHVLFFAPVVRRLEDQGHIVTLTARRFAERRADDAPAGLAAVLTGQHRGGGAGARAVGLVNRTAQLLASASSGRFDVAVGSHASDFVLTAWALGVPQLTLLDDERLGRANAVNVRLVDRVAVPDADPRRHPGAARRHARQALPLTRASRRSTTCTTSRPTPTSSPISASTADRASAWSGPRATSSDARLRPAWRRAALAAGARRRPTGAGDARRRASSRPSSASSPSRRNLTLVLAAAYDEQRSASSDLGLANLVVPEATGRRRQPDRRRRLRPRRRRRDGPRGGRASAPLPTRCRGAPRRRSTRRCSPTAASSGPRRRPTSRCARRTRGSPPSSAATRRLFVDEIVRLGTQGRTRDGSSDCCERAAGHEESCPGRFAWLCEARCGRRIRRRFAGACAACRYYSVTIRLCTVSTLPATSSE